MSIKSFKDNVERFFKFVSQDDIDLKDRPHMVNCKQFIKDIYSFGSNCLTALYKNSKIKSDVLSKILNEKEPNCLTGQLMTDIVERMSESKDNLKEGLRIIFDQSISAWKSSLNKFMNQTGGIDVDNREFGLLRDQLIKLVTSIEQLSKKYGYNFKWDEHSDYRTKLIS